MLTKNMREKLQVMAERGGTENERRIAREHLDKHTKVDVRIPEYKWTAMGVLIREKDGNKAYLRGSALVWFLLHVKDGQSFTYKNFPQDEHGSSGDFYVIITWLLPMGLVVKLPNSRYAVPSRKRVIDAWNATIDAGKIS